MGSRQREGALRSDAEKNYTPMDFEEIEQVLKNYPLTRGDSRRELDDFFLSLHEPLKTFADYRYRQRKTMERIAEIMNYSTRSMYVFRLRVIHYWLIFSKGYSIKE